jgi:tetratricopeptide (TPR) repeat protein/DNA-binding CsgD family transcriptional regulator
MNRYAFLLCLLMSVYCHAQQPSLQLLEKEFTINDLAHSPAWKAITATHDTAGAIRELEKKAAKENDQRSANRVHLFKCLYQYSSQKRYDDIKGSEWASLAIKNAIKQKDGIALNHAYSWYGYFMLTTNRPDTGILYYLKALDLYIKNGRSPETLLDQKIFVSTYLYRLHNYDLCKLFCQDAIANQQHLYEPSQIVIAWNNLGLYYEKTGNYDSAIHCFQKVEQEARMRKKTAWYGISVGNIGDAYEMKGEWEKAMRYWQQDYDTSVAYGSTRNAALTLAKMSLYDFKQGKQQQAMQQLERAMRWSEGSMLVLPTLYRIRAECYKMLKNTDSSYHYLQLYQQLTDSLDMVANRNSYNYLQLRLSFDEASHQYEVLQKEKKTEVTIRNLMLAGIIALVIIGLLFYNRQRLKHLHEKQLALQKQRASEIEIEAAAEQLAFFTRSILEKNETIAQLHAQLNQQQQTVNEELVSHTILTEDDWQHFRSLFEKAHPGFFERLRSQSPDITTAEMRLAALILLKLDNKQIASMQGISTVTVRSTKTRLRQRLGISLEDGLESRIQSL